EHRREVVAIRMFDGVDHRLAEGHADPVHRVFVEPDAATQMVADQLYEIEHVERAAEFQANDTTQRTRHADRTGRGDAARGKWITQGNWPVKRRKPARSRPRAARGAVASAHAIVAGCPAPWTPALRPRGA